MDEPERQVEGLFDVLLAQTMDKLWSTVYGQWSALAGVVARVEGLRGHMSEAGSQVNGLFESVLSEVFQT